MLTAKDLMTTNPITTTADVSLREALMRMKMEGCRQLLVINNNHLAGIITDRDIRLAMNSPMLGENWLNDSLLDNTYVSQSMTENPITITPDTPAYELTDMLLDYKFGALPVVDIQGHVAGIVTISDIMRHFKSLCEIESV
jgi:CBS domain-containing protein